MAKPRPAGKAPQAKAPIPLDTEADFKWWRLDQPNAACLLKEIIFRWRGSNGRIPGKAGKWAVWPIASWAEWSGLSSDQVERALAYLEAMRLIDRERHRFQGSKVRAFIRPTALALRYLGRPSDIKTAATTAVTTAGASAATTAGISAGTTAGTDHTSLPSSLSESKESTLPKGKEGPGEDMKIDYKEVMKANGWKIEEGMEEDEEFMDFMKLDVSKKEKKLQKLLKKFPILKGPHEAKVKHPYELHGVAWISWSAELHAKKYAQYRVYVENATKAAGKKKTSGGLFGGKANAPDYKPLALTEEDEELFEAEWAKTCASLNAQAEEATS